MVIWVLVTTSAKCTSTEIPSSHGAKALPRVSITRNAVNTPSSLHSLPTAHPNRPPVCLRPARSH